MIFQKIIINLTKYKYNDNKNNNKIINTITTIIVRPNQCFLQLFHLVTEGQLAKY